MSSTGDVTIQLRAAQASAHYGWQFCPLLSNDTCFDLGQAVPADGSGNGQVTFHFPKSGHWAGYFVGSAGADTLTTQDAAHGKLVANFVSQNGLNQHPLCGPTCRVSAAQGSVSVANNNAHIVITGAETATVDVYLWPGGHLQGSMTGNGAADVPVQNPGAAYEISDHINIGLVSGFTVP